MVKDRVQARGRTGQAGIDLLQSETCGEHPTHFNGSRASSRSFSVM